MATSNHGDNKALAATTATALKAALCGGLFLFAILVLASATLAQAGGMPPALVEVSPAVERMMAPRVFMPGTVVSRNDSRIAAEISGKIDWVAPEGTLVKEGDVVARIDARNIELRRARSASQVKRLQARVKFLGSQLKRMQELAATNNTPASRVDEAVSSLAMAEEELAQAEISLEEAKIDLARASVRAPFPGRVVSRLAFTGEYSTPGRQIVRLVDTENLEIRAQAPVNLTHVLRDGEMVTLRESNNYADSDIRAVIPVGDERSRTMEIRVNVPAGGNFVVGSAVQVGLPSAAPEQVVAVPRDALVLRADGAYVFRIKDDDTAERLAVTPGTATGTMVAVRVRGGSDITDGDRIVIRGGERLRPGQPVKLQTTTASAVLAEAVALGK